MTTRNATVTVTVNVSALLRKFAYRYDFLYNNRDAAPDFRTDMAHGEKLISSGNEIVRAMCRERCDCFTSDREVSALGHVLADVAAG
jgi:hypothetical protein